MNAATKRAIVAYRAAIVRQMALPVDRRWEMGSEIKFLKAAAYVEMECAKLRSV